MRSARDRKKAGKKAARPRGPLDERQKTLAGAGDSLRYAAALAHKHCRRVGRPDLFEEAMSVALWATVKAAGRFEFERGLKFSTYATPYVEYELLHWRNERLESAEIERPLEALTHAPAAPEPDPDGARALLSDHLRELVAMLPAHLGMALRLRSLARPPMTFRQVAQVLGCTPHEAKKKHKQAVAMLRVLASPAGTQEGVA